MYSILASVALTATLATRAVAQGVVGSPYGFAAGVTGGGDAVAATPSSADELIEWLSDDEARTILIDQEYDFTGEMTTGAGCYRESCPFDQGGQLYLGELSCGGEGEIPVDSITYDAGSDEPLRIGSNKSIVGVNGQGKIVGKGLRLVDGSSNIIIQGLEITNINPSVVWGGDAIDFQGNNDGVWVDHCKVSLVGRMFVVSHYDGSRMTISNNEFDGVTEKSASCNDQHYWTMMFYGDGDKVTLDRNYFHDVSGRAPKLGSDGVTAHFQASNNYFQNMKGHAFDAANGASVIIEGNVFEAVNQPMTENAATVSTIFNAPDDAASSCESFIGRACAVNSVDSSSGDFPAMSDTSALESFSSLADSLVEPLSADEVAAHVTANAGPANMGSADAAPAPVEESADEPEVPEPEPETPATPEPEAPAEPAPEEDASGATAQQWGQCGGLNYQGPTKCAAGTSCVFSNDWYSQCLSSAARRKMKRSIRRV